MLLHLVIKYIKVKALQIIGDLMKVVRVLLVVLMVFLVSLSFVNAAGIAGPDFQITLEEQNPDPAEPSEVVTLELKVENDGTEANSDVIVSIDAKYPLSIYDGVSERNVGSMRSGEVVSSIEFDLLIDDSAAQGDAEVDIYVGEEGSDVTQKFTFTVDIETRDAVLLIRNVELNPQTVAPGEQFDLLVTLSNEADSLLQSIYATLNTSEGQPVAAYLSSSEKIISSLSSGDAISLQYKLLVDPSIEYGLYRMPFTLKYEDRNGNSYSNTEYLSLFVGDITNIDLQVRSSTLWEEDTSGKVVFELANLGQGELKAVQLEILDGSGYELLSTQSRYYIGNVDSDDTETEEILIEVDDSLSEVEIMVSLTYLDALNIEFVEEYSLLVPIYSEEDAIELGITEAKSNIWIIVLVILLTIWGIWYYRKRQKDKKTPHKK